MTRTKVRLAAAAAALTLTAILAIPGFSATTPGSLSLGVPDSFVRDSVPVSWSYKVGAVVTTSSLVDLLATSDGTNWSPVAVRLPVRSGSYTWNTAGWSDAVYAVRLRVVGTNTYSPTAYAYVDHTAPRVEIVRPSPTAVLVDDQAVGPDEIVVAGRTTLKADAADALSGVESVVWQLDGNAIAGGATAVYDFTASPGRHELAVLATDAAGNTASAMKTIVALPGSAATNPGPLPDPGPAPSPDPSAIPSPDPSAVPTLPALPTVPPVPSPDPTTVPTPEPTSVPSPDPTALPIPTIPPEL